MASLQGCFLIAAPSLLEPSFARTVVLMVQHDENGAMGLIVNRPVPDLSLRKVWAEFSGDPCPVDHPVHQGGPCEGPLMVLHTQSAASQSQVLPGSSEHPALLLSTEESEVRWLVEHGVTPAKFFAGYAGWSPGQLEEEISEASWLTLPATVEQVFSEHDPWRLLVRRATHHADLRGLSPRILPDDPSLN